MRKDETFYAVHFVDGQSIRVRIPSNLTSPLLAMEFGVPMFAFPVEEGLPRYVINPANVLYIQEYEGVS